MVRVPVPTSGTRRRLRSGQTGCRRSARNRTKPLNATKRNRKKKPESFAQYDKALEDLKKRKRQPEETTKTNVSTDNAKAKITTNVSTDNNAKAKHEPRRERPIRSATKKALVDIGKVYRREQQSRSKLDKLLGVDSDDESKFDLYIPPVTRDGGKSGGSSVASSPLTVMTAPKTTVPITLPTLPPLTENVFNEESNEIIRTKDNNEVCFDSFVEQASSTRSLPPNSITDEINDIDSYTEKDYNENILQISTTTTNTTKRKQKSNGSKNTSLTDSIVGAIDDSNSNDCNGENTLQSTTTTTNTRNKKRDSSTNIKKNVIGAKRNEYQYQKIKKISDVYASFEIPKSTRSCIPTLTDLRNEEELKIKNSKKWQGLINMSTKCLDQTLRAICPGPSRTKLKLDIANKIIKNEQIGSDTHKTIPNYEKMTEKVIHTLFTMLKHSKHASTEKRILRAIVGKTIKRGIVQSKCNEYGLMDFTSGSIVAKINDDYESLMNGKTLQKKVQTKSRINHYIIAEAVSYILHKDHIITTSWGEREYELSRDEKITLPRLCRKQSPLNLWKSYASAHEKKIELEEQLFIT